MNMETSSPKTMSPPRHANEGSMAENGPPQGRVPRPQSVVSASRLPGSSISPQMASARYVKQFQVLMEHQRQAFDEERELWNTEREELHEKIAQLEGSLRRYQAVSSSQVLSPINNSNIPSQSNSSSRSLLGKDGSGHTSGTSTGHEIWRGPDVKPTRTFSDPTIQVNKPRGRSRLPSIAEDTTCGRKDSSDMHLGLHRSSISGVEIDKNLDGITFKSSPLSAAPTKKIMTPQSPSPGIPSPARVSPGAIQLPSSKLEDPPDHYTKDAGHTPLARRIYVNADGASSEGDKATPTQPEIERPPLEPHVSFARLPSERSDSYFPVLGDDSREKKDSSVYQENESRDEEDKSPDEDPELKGPLGLYNSIGEDDQFLHEVDSKLLEVTRSEASGPHNVGLDGQPSPAKNEEDLDQPEHEPKLRIKRSMNFGSAFGARDCGKGI